MKFDPNPRRYTRKLTESYPVFLATGYFFYYRWHEHAVICAFRNDLIGGYTLMKFDFEYGIRWLLNFATPYEAITVMRAFRHLGAWGVSPKSAFWRNMPPTLALLFNSRGVDASQIDRMVVTTIDNGENAT